MSEQELSDAIIRHSLQLLRLSAGEQAEAEAILRELEDELRRLLAGTNLSEARRRDIQALVDQAEQAIAASYDRTASVSDTHRLAVIVAQHTADLMGEALPAEFRIPSETTLASLTKDVMIDGAPASAWWAKQSEDTAFKFAAQVRQGVANNETQEQIVARIVGKRGEPGIMDIARRNARALVHSAVMSAANAARLATFRKNHRYVAGVRWLSTLDSHVCVTCGALDGASWDLDGKPIGKTTLQFQMPPAHFGCRCVASPVPARRALEAAFPGVGAQIDAGAMRASQNGPVANTTFASFLARQPEAFVNEVLGKKRAELYRAGKLTLRDLVSGRGRPLTLDELSAL